MRAYQRVVSLIAFFNVERVAFLQLMSVEINCTNT
jgi:hypothetical protein